MNSEFVKPTIFVLLVATTLVLNAVFGWSTNLENLFGVDGWQTIVQDNLPLAICVYMAVTIVGSVVLFMPGIVFAIVAGVAFGPVLGTILCLVAATIGASLSFLVGRFFLKDSLKPRIERSATLKRFLFDDANQNSVYMLAVTRLVPLFPYNLQNFAYGITDIGFWPYTFWSFVFMIPGTALYTVAAAGFVAQGQVGYYIAAVAILAILVTGLGVYLKKRSNLVPEDDDRLEALL